jgi:diketogulonate reductase-like aldo/keto reductase
MVTITKSLKESRIIEMANIFDFALTDCDTEKMNASNENKRFGADPIRRILIFGCVKLAC